MTKAKPGPAMGTARSIPYSRPNTHPLPTQIVLPKGPASTENGEVLAASALPRLSKRKTEMIDEKLIGEIIERKLAERAAPKAMPMVQLWPGGPLAEVQPSLGGTQG